MLITSASLLSACSSLDWCRSNPGRTYCDSVTATSSSIEVLWLEHLPAKQSELASATSPIGPSVVEVFATSGSTGKVKIVPHTDVAVLAHAEATISALGLSAQDEHCWAHAGPMFHVGDVAFVWVGLLIGARHVFIDNQLQLGLTVATLASEGVTITKLAPAMVTLLTGSKALEGMTFPALQWVLTGGARLDPRVAARAAAALGCDMLQGYGMTEATCHIAFKNETREASEAGLKPLPGLEIRIIAPRGEVAMDGEVGEIVIRGPTVTAGYQRAGSEEIDRSGFLPDGFLKSGDLGYLSSDGRLHVVGRVKDMINVGGENVFAIEVEQVVAELPGAASCSAFPQVDGLLGEVVAVAIEGDGGGLSEDDVRAHCRAKLASYKVPRTVAFVKELPRTATGKVRKADLADLIKPLVIEFDERAGSQRSRELTAFLIERIERHGSHLAPGSITEASNILELGIDSLNVIDLLLELERRCGTSLPPTLLYDYPTIRDVIAYLDGSDQGKDAPDLQPEMPPGGPTLTPASAAPRAGILSCLLQALGLLVRPVQFALASIPVVILAIVVAGHLGVLATLALSPLWVSLHVVLLMLLTAAAVRLLNPADTEFPLWGRRYCSWLTAQNLLRGQDEVMGLLRGTPALALYYRLLGARIGRGVKIETFGLTDPGFITIEGGVTLGRDVVLQPAVITASGVRRGPIRIGQNATIGPAANLVGETVVPAQSAVGVLGTGVMNAARKKPAALRDHGFGAYVGATYVYGFAVAGGLVLAALLSGQEVISLPQRLAAVVSGSSSLRWQEMFSLALTLQIALPLITFLLVAAAGGPLRSLLDRSGFGKLGASVYRSAIEVPFFPAWLRLTVMSPLAAASFRILGARVGTDTMLAGPYVEDPRRLHVGDEAILAGNVTILNGDGHACAAAPVTFQRQAIVANSCVLIGPASVPERTLLGDLSALSEDVKLPEGSVAVGPAARVVGRTRFHDLELRGRVEAAAMVLLGPLQIGAALVSSLFGFVAFAAILDLQLLPGMWNALWALPVALFARRLARVVVLVGLKWVVIGRVPSGEYPLMGGMYARWVLLEALIMEAERAILISMRGTVFLAALWRLLGARVGPGSCIMASSLGCEFDLKSIGAGAVLQPNAMVFAHSVEHHTLLFRATRIGNGANVGPNAIIEAGAEVADMVRVQANRAVHARPNAGRARIPARADDFGGDPVALEVRAKEVLAPAIFTYFASGAESGRALRRNIDVLKSIAICPRRLRDVSTIGLQVTLFGRELSSPILVAPSAMHRLLHGDGETAVARAVAARNAGMVLSMLSTTSLEHVVQPFRLSRGLALFQLYMLKDRGLTDALVQRAEAAGYDGIVVTVDSPASGRIDIDHREWLRFSQALELVHLPALSDTNVPPLIRFESMKDPSLNFSDLVALQARTKLPVCLKGILSPADAVLAASLGFRTLILSNHGGRRLGDEVSAVEMISPVRLALDKAGHDIRLLADGGIRTGSDVFKAIALGADAVLVGRAPLWGLAAAGEPGVARVLQRLDDELALTMKLAGCGMLGELTPDLLHLGPPGAAAQQLA